jgi:hypothetical protein
MCFEMVKAILTNNTVFWDVMLCRLVCRYISAGYLSRLEGFESADATQSRRPTEVLCKIWGSHSSVEEDFPSSGIRHHVEWYAGMYFQYTVLVLILNISFILKVQTFNRVYSNCNY